MASGCDMTEAELLAMLKGIDAAKIQSESVPVYPLKPSSSAAAAATATATTPAEEKAQDTGAGAGAAPHAAESVAQFLALNPEKGDMNQYWYSSNTIDAMVADVYAHGGAPLSVAFISTPSLYFSLPAECRTDCAVLDVSRFG